FGEEDATGAYDRLGMASARRLGWACSVVGAKKAFILEGGLQKWKDEGRPIETAIPRRPARTFRPRKPAASVALLADVQAALADKTAQVVDARPAERLRREAPEPRPGARAGQSAGW